MRYQDFSVGLTGGIGSGKTLVADLFADLGVTIVDADEIARNLTLPGGEGIVPIREQFGASFILPDGAMDRVMMREHVFAHPDERLKLEAILHPLIRDIAFRQAQNAKGDYVVFVNPLLVELPIWHGMGTRILVVDCPESLQISRVMKRNNMTEDQVKAIMATQASRAQRLAVAHDVIRNDGSIDEVVEAVRTLHVKYQEIARNCVL